MSGSQQYNTYLGTAAGYGKNLGSNNVAIGKSGLGGTDWRTLSSVNGDWHGIVGVGSGTGQYGANGFSTFIGQDGIWCREQVEVLTTLLDTMLVEV